MKQTLLIFFSLVMISILMAGCTGTDQSAEPTVVNSSFDIASDDYAALSETALNHLSALDIDAWLDMLSDDVEYYFPDGDEGNRTAFIGKVAVAEWWQNWKANSGVESMKITNTVHIPVNAKQSLNYSGLSGVFVLSYFSNEIVFGANAVRLRMNFATHYNENMLIDRYYTYYDRTPLIEAMGGNILEADAEE